MAAPVEVIVLSDSEDDRVVRHARPHAPRAAAPGLVRRDNPVHGFCFTYKLKDAPITEIRGIHREAVCAWLNESLPGGEWIFQLEFGGDRAQPNMHFQGSIKAKTKVRKSALMAAAVKAGLEISVRRMLMLL